MGIYQTVTPEMLEWLQDRLRRRFPRVGIWVELGGWDSSSVNVIVRSYRPASMETVSFSVVDGYREVNMKWAYRLTVRRIVAWRKSLR